MILKIVDDVALTQNLPQMFFQDIADFEVNSDAGKNIALSVDQGGILMPQAFGAD